MSQRSTSPLSRSTVRRTLQRFWGVTRTQPLIVFLSVFSSAGYIFLLTFANTYVMALIVDRVQAGPVAGDQVLEVFGPYILALVLVNLVGQILSKLQDDNFNRSASTKPGWQTSATYSNPFRYSRLSKNNFIGSRFNCSIA